VRLARGLSMQVIAEQVDTRPLLQALRDAGVRGAQGYLLGAPQPLDDIL
jgi:EAL domain-containing protein (putative c-di-GMP-specific phosphodiesterase class I)